MSDWYYSHDGEQKGPVPASELQRLASSGGFDKEKGLVWREGMADWLPVSSVPELQLDTATPSAAPGSGLATDAPTGMTTQDNPYAAPAVQSVDTYPTEGSDLPEIEPGSQPVDIGAVLGRSFELTKRHFGMVLAIGIIMIAISAGTSLVMGFVDTLIGYTPPDVSDMGFSTDNEELDVAL